MKTEKMLWLLIFLIDSVLSQSGSSELITCERPLPPENADIKTRKCVGGNCNYRGDTYREGDKVIFECKKEFKLAESVPYSYHDMSVTCESNGQWFPPIEKLKCVKCEDENQFRCKSNGEWKCLPKEKRCNCDFDCDDRSDEQNCPLRQKIIKTALKGSSGIISSPGYPMPKDYPKEYSCFYRIETEPGHYIKLNFEEFNLPKKRNKKCIDSVRLMSVFPDFLRKRRKNPQSMLVESQPRSSQTKCGSNGFKSVYSNSTYIGINVTLGYTSSKIGYTGFSLTWQVKTEKDLYYALYKLRRKNEPSKPLVSSQSNGGNDDDYTMATVVLPIALCGILPLSFLAFYFCPRIIKTNCSSPKTKTTKEAVLLTLTENNLAKFDEQMGSVLHSGSRLLQPPEGHSSTANNENRFDVPPRKSVSQNKKLDTGSSQNSDLPRYVMSYDIPLTHLPTRQSSHSLHRHSSNSHGVRSNSSRSNKTSQNNSSINSMSQQSCNKVSKNSRCRKYGDEHSSSSNVNGIQSACSGSSRSTKTCSLCNQQRRTCNAVKAPQQTTQPTNDYYSQLVPTVHEIDDLDLYGQSSRHQYMKNTYPEVDESEQLSEYIEIAGGRESFPYTDSSHSYPLPFKEKRNADSYRGLYHEILPNLTYSDSEITDPASTHLIEKRKVIYLEEICDTHERFLPVNNDLYGTANQAEKRELKLNMYTLRV